MTGVHLSPPTRVGPTPSPRPSADATLRGLPLVPPVLEARGLVKRYPAGGDEVPVLAGIDVAYEAGCLAAIAGPSGGGKSTLLNLLGLLDAPTAGEYHVDGARVDAHDAAQRTRLRREMFGFVFQSFNLVPVLSAAENVELGLSVLGVSRRVARAQALAMLERVGLADRANHRPDMLSGGQQQRVAIARALVKAPRVVFADEPTANLDARNTALVVALLEELNASEGVAFVIATHDPLVYGRARTVHTLVDGRLQPHGPPGPA